LERNKRNNRALTSYPFAALVGQEEMKLSLLLNVIDPSIGGVMVMGHRGTGKSTAVRALAELVPSIVCVRKCDYGCNPDDLENLCEDCLARSRTGRLARERRPVPVVDLPLGATEDRVCGTLDIERALQTGRKTFEPGLLARANRGFLYIDEVNLLEDHLVDVLLDVAASGWNVVEREGISVTHPARFVLVGSGNPEEGELRPQLLDRFGLHARIETISDIRQRIEIVRRRDSYDRHPDKFVREWEGEQKKLRARISRARRIIDDVSIGDESVRMIADLCQRLRIDGHRGELTIVRAARALAAFEGRRMVDEDDITRVAVMALRHRMRKDPLESIDSGVRIERALELGLKT